MKSHVETNEEQTGPGTGESQSGVGHCSRRVNVGVEKNTAGQMVTGQMAKGQNDQEKLEQATEFEEALQGRYGAATGRGGESAASSHEGGRG